VLIKERSYRSGFARPRPLIFKSEENHMILVVTPWGDPSVAMKVNNEIVDYVSAAKTDVDITSPFDFYEGQPSLTNYLRIGLLLANDAIYRSENKTEYTAGFEILAIAQRGRQLSWASVGQPHLLLQKGTHGGVHPISFSYDLALESERHLASLPSEMLGVSSICQVNCGQFSVSPSDSLILLSGLSWPAFYPAIQSMSTSLQVDSATTSIVEAGHDRSFWMATIQLEES